MLKGFFVMNKELINQKIDEIKAQLVKIISEFNGILKNIQSDERSGEDFKNILKNKLGHAYDYVVQNKITATILASLIVWNLFLSYILITNFSELNNLPTDYDFDKLEDEFEDLSNRFDNFEDTYVFKIEDLIFTVNTIKPRIENLEDYSHTHY